MDIKFNKNGSGIRERYQNPRQIHSHQASKEESQSDFKSHAGRSRHTEQDWNNYNNALIESPFKLRQSNNARINEIRCSKESWYVNN